jgi:predicted transglutaminase-like cysteine proteinase
LELNNQFRPVSNNPSNLDNTLAPELQLTLDQDLQRHVEIEDRLDLTALTPRALDQVDVKDDAFWRELSIAFVDDVTTTHAFTTDTVTQLFKDGTLTSAMSLKQAGVAIHGYLENWVLESKLLVRTFVNFEASLLKEFANKTGNEAQGASICSTECQTILNQYEASVLFHDQEGKIQTLIPGCATCKPYESDQVISMTRLYGDKDIADVQRTRTSIDFENANAYIQDESPAVQRLLNEIFKSGVTGLSQEEIVTQVHNFMIDDANFQYVEDQEENWAEVVTTIAHRSGDCEDLTIVESSVLIAALKGAGYEDSAATVTVVAGKLRVAEPTLGHTVTTFTDSQGNEWVLDATDNRKLDGLSATAKNTFLYDTFKATYNFVEYISFSQTESTSYVSKAELLNFTTSLDMSIAANWDAWLQGNMNTVSDDIVDAAGGSVSDMDILLDLMTGNYENPDGSGNYTTDPEKSFSDFYADALAFKATVTSTAQTTPPVSSGGGNILDKLGGYLEEFIDQVGATTMLTLNEIKDAITGTTAPVVVTEFASVESAKSWYAAYTDEEVHWMRFEMEFDEMRQNLTATGMNKYKGQTYSGYVVYDYARINRDHQKLLNSHQLIMNMLSVKMSLANSYNWIGSQMADDNSPDPSIKGRSQLIRTVQTAQQRKIEEITIFTNLFIETWEEHNSAVYQDFSKAIERKFSTWVHGLNDIFFADDSTINKEYFMRILNAEYFAVTSRIREGFQRAEVLTPSAAALSAGYKSDATGTNLHQPQWWAERTSTMDKEIEADTQKQIGYTFYSDPDPDIDGKLKTIVDVDAFDYYMSWYNPSIQVNETTYGYDTDGVLISAVESTRAATQNEIDLMHRRSDAKSSNSAVPNYARSTDGTLATYDKTDYKSSAAYQYFYEEGLEFHKFFEMESDYANNLNYGDGKYRLREEDLLDLVINREEVVAGQTAGYLKTGAGADDWVTTSDIFAQLDEATYFKDKSLGTINPNAFDGLDTDNNTVVDGFMNTFTLFDHNGNALANNSEAVRAFKRDIIKHGQRFDSLMMDNYKLMEWDGKKATLPERDVTANIRSLMNTSLEMDDEVLEQAEAYQNAQAEKEFESAQELVIIDWADTENAAVDYSTLTTSAGYTGENLTAASAAAKASLWDAAWIEAQTNHGALPVDELTMKAAFEAQIDTIFAGDAATLWDTYITPTVNDFRKLEGIQESETTISATEVKAFMDANYSTVNPSPELELDPVLERLFGVKFTTTNQVHEMTNLAEASQEIVEQNLEDDTDGDLPGIMMRIDSSVIEGTGLAGANLTTEELTILQGLEAQIGVGGVPDPEFTDNGTVAMQVYLQAVYGDPPATPVNVIDEWQLANPIPTITSRTHDVALRISAGYDPVYGLSEATRDDKRVLSLANQATAVDNTMTDEGIVPYTQAEIPFAEQYHKDQVARIDSLERELTPIYSGEIGGLSNPSAVSTDMDGWLAEYGQSGISKREMATTDLMMDYMDYDRTRSFSDNMSTRNNVDDIELSGRFRSGRNDSEVPQYTIQGGAGSGATNAPFLAMKWDTLVVANKAMVDRFNVTRLFYYIHSNITKSINAIAKQMDSLASGNNEGLDVDSQTFESRTALDSLRYSNILNNTQKIIQLNNEWTRHKLIHFKLANTARRVAKSIGIWTGIVGAIFLFASALLPEPISKVVTGVIGVVSTIIGLVSDVTAAAIEMSTALNTPQEMRENLMDVISEEGASDKRASSQENFMKLIDYKRPGFDYNLAPQLIDPGVSGDGSPISDLYDEWAAEYGDCSGCTDLEIAENVHAFVRSGGVKGYTYSSETTGDVWKTVDQTITDGGGDCEDFALLEASLLMRALEEEKGIAYSTSKANIKLYAGELTPNAGGTVGHVFTVYNDGTTDYVMDGTDNTDTDPATGTLSTLERYEDELSFSNFFTATYTTTNEGAVFEDGITNDDLYNYYTNFFNPFSSSPPIDINFLKDTFEFILPIPKGPKDYKLTDSSGNQHNVYQNDGNWRIEMIPINGDPMVTTPLSKQIEYGISSITVTNPSLSNDPPGSNQEVVSIPDNSQPSVTGNMMGDVDSAMGNINSKFPFGNPTDPRGIINANPVSQNTSEETSTDETFVSADSGSGFSGINNDLYGGSASRLTSSAFFVNDQNDLLDNEYIEKNLMMNIFDLGYNLRSISDSGNSSRKVVDMPMLQFMKHELAKTHQRMRFSMLKIKIKVDWVATIASRLSDTPKRSATAGMSQIFESQFSRTTEVLTAMTAVFSSIQEANWNNSQVASLRTQSIINFASTTVWSILAGLASIAAVLGAPWALPMVQALQNMTTATLMFFVDIPHGPYYIKDYKDFDDEVSQLGDGTLIDYRNRYDGASTNPLTIAQGNQSTVPYGSNMAWTEMQTTWIGKLGDDSDTASLKANIDGDDYAHDNGRSTENRTRDGNVKDNESFDELVDDYYVTNPQLVGDGALIQGIHVDDSEATDSIEEYLMFQSYRRNLVENGSRMLIIGGNNTPTVIKGRVQDRQFTDDFLEWIEKRVIAEMLREVLRAARSNYFKSIGAKVGGITTMGNDAMQFNSSEGMTMAGHFMEQHSMIGQWQGTKAQANDLKYQTYRTYDKAVLEGILAAGTMALGAIASKVSSAALPAMGVALSMTNSLGGLIYNTMTGFFSDNEIQYPATDAEEDEEVDPNETEEQREKRLAAKRKKRKAENQRNFRKTNNNGFSRFVGYSRTSVDHRQKFKALKKLRTRMTALQATQKVAQSRAQFIESLAEDLGQTTAGQSFSSGMGSLQNTVKGIKEKMIGSRFDRLGDIAGRSNEIMADRRAAMMALVQLVVQMMSAKSQFKKARASQKAAKAKKSAKADKKGKAKKSNKAKGKNKANKGEKAGKSAKNAISLKPPNFGGGGYLGAFLAPFRAIAYLVKVIAVVGFRTAKFLGKKLVKLARWAGGKIKEGIKKAVEFTKKVIKETIKSARKIDIKKTLKSVASKVKKGFQKLRDYFRKSKSNSDGGKPAKPIHKQEAQQVQDALEVEAADIDPSAPPPAPPPAPTSSSEASDLQANAAEGGSDLGADGDALDPAEVLDATPDAAQAAANAASSPDTAVVADTGDAGGSSDATPVSSEEDKRGIVTKMKDSMNDKATEMLSDPQKAAGFAQMGGHFLRRNIDKFITMAMGIVESIFFEQTLKEIDKDTKEDMEGEEAEYGDDLEGLEGVLMSSKAMKAGASTSLANIQFLKKAQEEISKSIQGIVGNIANDIKAALQTLRKEDGSAMLNVGEKHVKAGQSKAAADATAGVLYDRDIARGVPPKKAGERRDAALRKSNIEYNKVLIETAQKTAAQAHQGTGEDGPQFGVFRDNFDTALGAVFGKKVSPTVRQLNVQKTIATNVSRLEGKANKSLDKEAAQKVGDKLKGVVTNSQATSRKIKELAKKDAKTLTPAEADKLVGLIADMNDQMQILGGIDEELHSKAKIDAGEKKAPLLGDTVGNFNFGKNADVVFGTSDGTEDTPATIGERMGAAATMAAKGTIGIPFILLAKLLDGMSKTPSALYNMPSTVSELGTAYMDAQLGRGVDRKSGKSKLSYNANAFTAQVMTGQMIANKDDNDDFYANRNKAIDDYRTNRRDQDDKDNQEGGTKGPLKGMELIVDRLEKSEGLRQALASQLIESSSNATSMFYHNRTDDIADLITDMIGSNSAALQSVGAKSLMGSGDQAARPMDSALDSAQMIRDTFTDEDGKFNANDALTFMEQMEKEGDGSHVLGILNAAGERGWSAVSEMVKEMRGADTTRSSLRESFGQLMTNSPEEGSDGSRTGVNTAKRYAQLRSRVGAKQAAKTEKLGRFGGMRDHLDTGSGQKRFTDQLKAWEMSTNEQIESAKGPDSKSKQRTAQIDSALQLFIHSGDSINEEGRKTLINIISNKGGKGGDKVDDGVVDDKQRVIEQLNRAMKENLTGFGEVDKQTRDAVARVSREMGLPADAVPIITPEQGISESFDDSKKRSQQLDGLSPEKRTAVLKNVDAINKSAGVLRDERKREAELQAGLSKISVKLDGAAASAEGDDDGQAKAIERVKELQASLPKSKEARQALVGQIAELGKGLETLGTEIEAHEEAEKRGDKKVEVKGEHLKLSHSHHFLADMKKKKQKLDQGVLDSKRHELVMIDLTIQANEKELSENEIAIAPARELKEAQDLKAEFEKGLKDAVQNQVDHQTVVENNLREMLEALDVAGKGTALIDVSKLLKLNPADRNAEEVKLETNMTKAKLDPKSKAFIRDLYRVTQRALPPQVLMGTDSQPVSDSAGDPRKDPSGERRPGMDQRGQTINDILYANQGGINDALLMEMGRGNTIEGLKENQFSRTISTHLKEKPTGDTARIITKAQWVVKMVMEQLPDTLEITQGDKTKPENTLKGLKDNLKAAIATKDEGKIKTAEEALVAFVSDVADGLGAEAQVMQTLQVNAQVGVTLGTMSKENVTDALKDPSMRQALSNVLASGEPEEGAKLLMEMMTKVDSSADTAGKSVQSVLSLLDGVPNADQRSAVFAEVLETMDTKIDFNSLQKGEIGRLGGQIGTYLTEHPNMLPTAIETIQEKGIFRVMTAIEMVWDSPNRVVKDALLAGLPKHTAAAYNKHIRSGLQGFKTGISITIFNEVMTQAKNDSMVEGQVDNVALQNDLKDQITASYLSEGDPTKQGEKLEELGRYVQQLQNVAFASRELQANVRDMNSALLQATQSYSAELQVAADSGDTDAQGALINLGPQLTSIENTARETLIITGDTILSQKDLAKTTQRVRLVKASEKLGTGPTTRMGAITGTDKSITRDQIADLLTELKETVLETENESTIVSAEEHKESQNRVLDHLSNLQLKGGLPETQLGEIRMLLENNSDMKALISADGEFAKALRQVTQKVVGKADSLIKEGKLAGAAVLAGNPEQAAKRLHNDLHSDQPDVKAGAEKTVGKMRELARGGHAGAVQVILNLTQKGDDAFGSVLTAPLNESLRADVAQTALKQLKHDVSTGTPMDKATFEKKLKDIDKLNYLYTDEQTQELREEVEVIFAARSQLGGALDTITSDSARSVFDQANQVSPENRASIMNSLDRKAESLISDILERKAVKEAIAEGLKEATDKLPAALENMDLFNDVLREVIDKVAKGLTLNTSVREGLHDDLDEEIEEVSEKRNKRKAALREAFANLPSANQAKVIGLAANLTDSDRGVWFGSVVAILDLNQVNALMSKESSDALPEMDPKTVLTPKNRAARAALLAKVTGADSGQSSLATDTLAQMIEIDPTVQEAISDGDMDEVLAQASPESLHHLLQAQSNNVDKASAPAPDPFAPQVAPQDPTAALSASLIQISKSRPEVIDRFLSVTDGTAQETQRAAVLDTLAGNAINLGKLSSNTVTALITHTFKGVNSDSQPLSPSQTKTFQEWAGKAPSAALKALRHKGIPDSTQKALMQSINTKEVLANVTKRTLGNADTINDLFALSQKFGDDDMQSQIADQLVYTQTSETIANFEKLSPALQDRVRDGIATTIRSGRSDTVMPPKSGADQVKYDKLHQERGDLSDQLEQAQQTGDTTAATQLRAQMWTVSDQIYQMSPDQRQMDNLRADQKASKSKLKGLRHKQNEAPKKSPPGRVDQIKMAMSEAKSKQALNQEITIGERGLEQIEKQIAKLSGGAEEVGSRADFQKLPDGQRIQLLGLAMGMTPSEVRMDNKMVTPERPLMATLQQWAIQHSGEPDAAGGLSLMQAATDRGVLDNEVMQSETRQTTSRNSLDILSLTPIGFFMPESTPARATNVQTAAGQKLEQTQQFVSLMKTADSITGVEGELAKLSDKDIKQLTESINLDSVPTDSKSFARLSNLAKALGGREAVNGSDQKTNTPFATFRTAVASRALAMSYRLDESEGAEDLLGHLQGLDGQTPTELREVRDELVGLAISPSNSQASQTYQAYTDKRNREPLDESHPKYEQQARQLDDADRQAVIDAMSDQRDFQQDQMQFNRAGTSITLQENMAMSQRFENDVVDMKTVSAQANTFEGKSVDGPRALTELNPKARLSHNQGIIVGNMGKAKTPEEFANTMKAAGALMSKMPRAEAEGLLRSIQVETGRLENDPGSILNPESSDEKGQIKKYQALADIADMMTQVSNSTQMKGSVLVDQGTKHLAKQVKETLATLMGGAVIAPSPGSSAKELTDHLNELVGVQTNTAGTKEDFIKATQALMKSAPPEIRARVMDQLNEDQVPSFGGSKKDVPNSDAYKLIRDGMMTGSFATTIAKDMMKPGTDGLLYESQVNTEVAAFSKRVEASLDHFPSDKQDSLLQLLSSEVTTALSPSKDMPKLTAQHLRMVIAKAEALTDIIAKRESRYEKTAPKSSASQKVGVTPPVKEGDRLAGELQSLSGQDGGATPPAKEGGRLAGELQSLSGEDGGAQSALRETTSAMKSLTGDDAPLPSKPSRAADLATKIVHQLLKQPEIGGAESDLNRLGSLISRSNIDPNDKVPGSDLTNPKGEPILKELAKKVGGRSMDVVASAVRRSGKPDLASAMKQEGKALDNKRTGVISRVVESEVNEILGESKQMMKSTTRLKQMLLSPELTDANKRAIMVRLSQESPKVFSAALKESGSKAYEYLGSFLTSTEGIQSLGATVLKMSKSDRTVMHQLMKGYVDGDPQQQADIDKFVNTSHRELVGKDHKATFEDLMGQLIGVMHGSNGSQEAIDMVKGMGGIEMILAKTELVTNDNSQGFFKEYLQGDYDKKSQSWTSPVWKSWNIDRKKNDFNSVGQFKKLNDYQEVAHGKAGVNRSTTPPTKMMVVVDGMLEKMSGNELLPEDKDADVGLNDITPWEGETAVPTRSDLEAQLKALEDSSEPDKLEQQTRLNEALSALGDPAEATGAAVDGLIQNLSGLEGASAVTDPDGVEGMTDQMRGLLGANDSLPELPKEIDAESLPVKEFDRNVSYNMIWSLISTKGDAKTNDEDKLKSRAEIIKYMASQRPEAWMGLHQHLGGKDKDMLVKLTREFLDYQPKKGTADYDTAQLGKKNLLQTISQMDNTKMKGATRANLLAGLVTDAYQEGARTVDTESLIELKNSLLEGESPRPDIYAQMVLDLEQELGTDRFEATILNSQFVPNARDLVNVMHQKMPERYITQTAETMGKLHARFLSAQSPTNRADATKSLVGQTLEFIDIDPSSKKEVPMHNKALRKIVGDVYRKTLLTELAGMTSKDQVMDLGSSIYPDSDSRLDTMDADIEDGLTARKGNAHERVETPAVIQDLIKTKKQIAGLGPDTKFDLNEYINTLKGQYGSLAATLSSLNMGAQSNISGYGAGGISAGTIRI